LKIVKFYNAFRTILIKHNKTKEGSQYKVGKILTALSKRSRGLSAALDLLGA
jgi:hypothetical protein